MYLFFLIEKKYFKCYTLNRLHTCYNQFRYLYKAIDEHWDIFTNDVEIQILNDYAKLSRKVTKYYASKYNDYNSILEHSIVPQNYSTSILMERSNIIKQITI